MKRCISEEVGSNAHTNCQEQSILQNSDDPVHDNDLNQSLNTWAKDVQALLQSEELRRVVSSTGTVITTATRHAPALAFNVIFMPIKAPMHIVGTMWDVATNQVNSGLLTLHEQFVGTNDLNTVSNDERLKQSNSSLSTLIDLAGSIPPVIQSVVIHAKDEIGSTVSNLLEICSLPNNIGITVGRVDSDISNETCTSTTSSISDDEDSSSGDQEVYPSINDEDIYMIRICDIGVFQSKKFTSNYIALNSSNNVEQKSLIDELFSSMTESALQLMEDGVRFDSFENDERTNMSHLIDWKGVGSSVNLMKKNKDNWTSPNVLRQMETELLVWIGRIQSTTIKSYARDVPLFKARGIIPNRSPSQLMELLYDSAQCQKYNKYSNGRKDICILQRDSHGMCKIVENETKIPFSGKVIKMKVLMLVKPLTEGGFIIISRSVHNGQFNTTSKIGSQNEIIWSVNILRCISDPLKTDLTVMTQANSSMIPMFFAEKVGTMCIMDFMRDLRKV